MSKTNIKPDTRSYGSYTQMFLDNPDKHFIDAEKALTYNEVLSWGGRKHSEGMMPFMNEEPSGYPAMDYLWPPTDIWEDEDDADQNSDRENEEEAAYRFFCDIVCETMVTSCNNTDPVRCYYGAVTGSGDLSRWSVTEGPESVSFSESGGYVWITPSANWDSFGLGTSFDLGLLYQDTGSATDEWYYHPVLNMWIKILAGSSTCDETVPFRCCNTIDELLFDDDNTPDTIGKADSITIYVEDNGAAPYTWVTSDQGYTLDAFKTDNPQNTLNCVDGVCGVDYEPYATIVVTDACDNQVTFVIRNDEGHWENKGEYCGLSSAGGATETGPSTRNFSYELVYGYQKQEQDASWRKNYGTSCGASCTPPCSTCCDGFVYGCDAGMGCDPCDSCLDWDDGCNTPRVPCYNCIPEGPCYCPGGAGTEFQCYAATWHDYYEWEC